MDGYAKQQIGELLARSAFALDHQDLPALAVTFHKDAKFTLVIDGVEEPAVFTGRNEILGLMQGAFDQQTDLRRHVISNVFYTQTGETSATVCSYLTLFATENGQTNLITTGLYTDQVAKAGIDGGWVVEDRHLKLDRPY